MSDHGDEEYANDADYFGEDEYDEAAEIEEESEEETDDKDEEYAEDEEYQYKEVIKPSKIKPDFISQYSNRIRTIYVVPEEEMITDNTLHLNELAQALSARATQIENSGRAYIPIKSSNSSQIAYEELFNGMNPFMIERIIGETSNGDRIVERFKINNMAKPLLPEGVFKGG